jgi:hypothetical protein
MTSREKLHLNIKLRRRRERRMQKRQQKERRVSPKPNAKK